MCGKNVNCVQGQSIQKIDVTFSPPSLRDFLKHYILKNQMHRCEISKKVYLESLFKPDFPLLKGFKTVFQKAAKVHVTPCRPPLG